MIKARKPRANALRKTAGDAEPEDVDDDDDKTVVVHKRVKEQPPPKQDEEVIMPGPEDDDTAAASRALPAASGAVAVDAESKPKKQGGKFGPTSASSYVRMTTYMDYKPELCADYNKSGYCGFGDNCIYIHDRTTYVSGNELDRRWEELQKQKKKENDAAQELHDQARLCGICKRELAKPVVKTKCSHLFCKQCAFDRYAKGQADCATCGKHTAGVFNEVPVYS